MARMRAFDVMIGIALGITVVTAGHPADGDSKIYEAGTNGVSIPILLKTKPPVMPGVFHYEGVDARVLYRALIARDGSVRQLEMVTCMTKGPKDAELTKEPADRCKPFDAAARKAILKWKYEPARKDGQPVDVYFGVATGFNHGD